MNTRVSSWRLSPARAPAPSLKTAFDRSIVVAAEPGGIPAVSPISGGRAMKSLLSAILVGLVLSAPPVAAAEPKKSQPSAAFKGKVDLDVRDSLPDWTPYTPKKAPEGA